MKILASASSLCLLLSIINLVSIGGTTAQCFDYTDVFDPDARVPTACKVIDKAKEPIIKFPSQAKFVVNYKCEIQNDQGLCEKAEESIQQVCGILSKDLKLRTDINVNVTLRNLCPTDVKQPCKELGGARFARTMELLDEDGMIREYPTALVKQFGCEQHYDFGDVDIVAVFNGGNVSSLWFEGDPQITPDQTDFRGTVLRGFLNGLGIRTSWAEQSIFAKVIPKILTPQLTLLEISKENGGGFEFKGFKEYVFDKYLVLRGDKANSVHEVTKSLDGFVTERTFKDKDEFISKLFSSPQIGMVKRMVNVTVNPFTLGFQPRGAKSKDEVIVLETSLNPYKNGVSINNFDASTYAGTKDFLMTSPFASGKTLEDSMGKSPSPLGPKLISLLETLGYPTKNLPENDVKVCKIPPPPPPKPLPPLFSSPPDITTTSLKTSTSLITLTTTIPVVATTTIKQGTTDVVTTKTQNVVTVIESASETVVTFVEVVTPPPQQTAPPTDSSQEGDSTDNEDSFSDVFAGSSSINLHDNLLTLIFITLLGCILGNLNI